MRRTLYCINLSRSPHNNVLPQNFNLMRLTDDRFIGKFKVLQTRLQQIELRAVSYTEQCSGWTKFQLDIVQMQESRWDVGSSSLQDATNFPVAGTKARKVFMLIILVRYIMLFQLVRVRHYCVEKLVFVCYLNY